MTYLIISLIALAVCGFLHGTREKFHQNPKVFEFLYGVEERSFWGSKGWERKYKNYPTNKRPRNWYNHLHIHLNDFWHLVHYIGRSAFIVGTAMFYTSENPYISSQNNLLVSFICVSIILTFWGGLGFWVMALLVKKEKNTVTGYQ